jgi:hypothetical protein
MSALWHLEFEGFGEVCGPLLKILIEQLRCFNKDQVEVFQLWL